MSPGYFTAVWSLCSFTILVDAAGNGLTSHYVSRSPREHSETQKFLKADIPTMPEQHHKKSRGSGYSEGSPLYKQQQKGGQVPERKHQLAPQVEVEPELPASSADLDHNDVLDMHPSATPVSTTMWCIINLCVQYFVLYALFVLVRFCQLFSPQVNENGRPSKLLQTLDACQSTVNFAPMLCVLFLATRVRAIQLTQGQTERYDLPQQWCRLGMVVCTSAVFWQLILLLCTSCCTGQAPTTDQDGNLDHPTGGNRCCLYTVQFFRYLLMLCLYGGFTVVCVALILMEAPKEVYPDGAPPVSVTAQCIITLSVQYFLVYLVLALLRTYNQIKNFSRTKASDLFQVAAYTVNFVPMLCILFLLARMRSLQLDPQWGKPQVWAEICFWVCTTAVNLQTIFVLVVPILLGGQVSPGTTEGDVHFKFNSSALKTVFLMIRCVLLLCLYGGSVAILASVCLIEHTSEADHVPPLSPAMQCVMILCALFFGVYFFLCLANIATGGFRGEDATPSSSKAVLMLESARGAVNLCPMLCVLLLGIRMRAMQITSNQGCPQGWAQDCMYACVFSLCAQLVLQLVAPLLSGRVVPTSNSGASPTTKGNTLALVIEGLVIVCLAITYCAAIGVMVAVFTMTVENANGRGSKIPVTDDVDPRSVDTSLALAQLSRFR